MKTYYFMNKWEDVCLLMATIGFFISIVCLVSFRTYISLIAGLIIIAVRVLWIITREVILCSKFDETDAEKQEREDHLYC